MLIETTVRSHFTLSTLIQIRKVGGEKEGKKVERKKY